jgi:hypothetical protein
MLGLPKYYCFNLSLLKFYTFSSALSTVSRTPKILRENRQDCISSYAVSIFAWREKTDGRKDRTGAVYIYICSHYLEQLIYTLKNGLLTP